jgi:two-component system, NtrC family, sensor kinase
VTLVGNHLERRLAREITSRKEAERLLEAKSLELYNKTIQLADYSKQLEAALERMSAIMASVPDVIVTCNASCVVEDINDACKAVLGYTPHELIGVKLDAIIPCASGSCGGAACPKGRVGETPLHARTKSGEQIEIEIREKTAWVKNQIFYVYVIQDVTARNAAQRLNDKIARQLHESRRLEAIGTLASGIAHEINTPIQFIGDNVAFVRGALKSLHGSYKSYDILRTACVRNGVCPEEVRAVETFNREIDLPFLIREIFTAMQEASEGLAHVRDIVLLMRDFAHPGTGEAEEADINAIIRNALTICRNRWKNTVSLETELADDLPRISCHAGQLQQVIVNLIINAVEAIEEANPAGGKIRLTTARAENGVRIQMSDDGPGVPDQLREKIFDPFFTTKTVGKGTGQGLALAKDIIVNHHGGRLYLIDLPGFSTTFVIELPSRLLPSPLLLAPAMDIQP